jgi:hypothetical protein
MNNDTMKPAEAYRIVDGLIASGKAPAAMTETEREAVRIVWQQLEQQFAPIRAQLAAFTEALQGPAEAMAAYGRAVSESLARMNDALPVIRLQQPAFMRPAWQRRA